MSVLLYFIEQINDDINDVFYQALAVVDSAVLLSFLPNVLLSVWRSVDRAYAYTYSWINVATYWFRTANTWLTVLLTLNRYLRVCQPLEFNQLCSVRRTYIVSTAYIDFTTQ